MGNSWDFNGISMGFQWVLMGCHGFFYTENSWDFSEMKRMNMDIFLRFRSI
jgi:hypothetical protein